MTAAPYLGEAPLAGLSARQVAAIEAACRAAPDQSHDGLWRLVAQNIGDVPTSDYIVQASIASAMADNNISTSFLIPHPTAATAGLGGSSNLGTNVTSRQLLNKTFGASASFGADIVKA